MYTCSFPQNPSNALELERFDVKQKHLQCNTFVLTFVVRRKLQKYFFRYLNDVFADCFFFVTLSVE